MKKFLNISLAIFTLFIGAQDSFAQDGAQLFKAKCNTCHMVDKNSTGPILKGVKQKWTDAGESEMLYEWVRNSQTLIVGGKSKMANEIKGFSPTAMSPQVASNEEIDAILNYVDNFKIEDPIKTDVVQVDPTIAKTNYTQNLTIFYWLIATLIILLIGIIVITGSISSLINSNYFKKKIKENTENPSKYMHSILLLIGFFGLMGISNYSSAMSMSLPDGEKDQPWLLVEDIDLYLMVVFNLILLIVLLYLRGMLKDYLHMASPVFLDAQRSKRKPKKINDILTNAVAIEEEHTILMQHEYDGIRELDNNLPPWWVWGFFATIIFAIVYLFNFHFLKTSDLQITAYEKEMAQSKKDIDAYLSKMAMNVDENTATLLTDNVALSSGKALFGTNCVTCHKQNAEGDIGPNLTDNFWIYGADVKDLFKTIKYGTPNGMPEHASKLNPIQMQQVSSYILSLPFTKGKEAQGKEYKK